MPNRAIWSLARLSLSLSLSLCLPACPILVEVGVLSLDAVPLSGEVYFKRHLPDIE